MSAVVQPPLAFDISNTPAAEGLGQGGDVLP